MVSNYKLAYNKAEASGEWTIVVNIFPNLSPQKGVEA